MRFIVGEREQLFPASAENLRATAKAGRDGTMGKKEISGIAERSIGKKYRAPESVHW